MNLKIRNSTFEVLFENILRRFPQNWDCFETNDKAKNPLVVFQVHRKKDWIKLIKLCKAFVNSSNDNFCLKRGSIKGFIHLYEMQVKWGK